MVSESSDLKYFGPVSEKTGQAANYTSDVASKVYTTVKQKSPESAQPYFKLAEDKFSEYGSPILTTVQDKSGKFVQIADEQVSFRCFGVVASIYASLPDLRSRRHGAFHD